MNVSITKKHYYFFFVVILLISSLVPFISIPFFYKYQYMGSGDFLVPLNNYSIFFKNLFVYNPFLYGGSNAGASISKIFPELFLYITLGYFGLNPSFITLLYVSLIILSTEISMFYFLVYVFTYKLNILSERKYFFAIIGSIIYAFSPHFIAAVPPGHFTQLTVYAFFPLLLVLFEKNLHSKKINFKMFFEYFVIFLLCATTFGNIAFIYILLFTFGIYSILKILIEKTSVIKVIKNLFIFIFSIILSNIFWLLSSFSTLGQLTNLSKETLVDLDNSVYLAVTKVNIPNLFFGKTEWQLYLMNSSYYINFFSLLIFIFISIFFIISIIKSKKNKFVIISLSMLVFAIFINKGPREPFGQLFMWLYHNLFGFQVFRRPTSKYYGIFLLFYFTLSLIGIMLTSIKLSAKKFFLLIVIPISIIIFYIVIIFVKTFILTPFNIPNYYKEALDYLNQNKVKKVLILPGIHGLQPTYDKSINNLYTTDFLYSIWFFPFDTPVDANFATDYIKKIINPIMKKIRKGNDFCVLTKETGISHIMLRHDLSINNPFEDKPKNLSKILDNNELVVGKKDFYSNEGKGFTIYTLNANCSANLIQLTKKNETHIDFQIINPTKIKISILKLKNINVLKYLNNFQNNWNIYLSKYSNDFFIKNESINVNTYPNKKIFFEGDELQFFTKKPLFEESHKINKSWGNQWTIDPQYIKENYSDSYYKKNSDGSINIQLILYYKMQSYLYIGLIIFGFILLVFLLYFCLSTYLKITKISN